VLPPEQATLLASTAYRLRSQTAHSGMLHGAESAFGDLRDTDLRIDAAKRFEEGDLDSIQPSGPRRAHPRPGHVGSITGRLSPLQINCVVRRAGYPPRDSNWSD
jgi:hypothetical protein